MKHLRKLVLTTAISLMALSSNTYSRIYKVTIKNNSSEPITAQLMKKLYDDWKRQDFETLIKREPKRVQELTIGSNSAGQFTIKDFDSNLEYKVVVINEEKGTRDEAILESRGTSRADYTYYSKATGIGREAGLQKGRRSK